MAWHPVDGDVCGHIAQDADGGDAWSFYLKVEGGGLGIDDHVWYLNGFPSTLASNTRSFERSFKRNSGR